MTTILLFLTFLVSATAYEAVVGPHGYWLNNNVTERGHLDWDINNAYDYRPESLSPDYIWCTRISVLPGNQVLGGGLNITGIGLWANNSGVPVRMGIYNDTLPAGTQPDRLLTEVKFNTTRLASEVSLPNPITVNVTAGGKIHLWICLLHGSYLVGFAGYNAEGNTLDGTYRNWNFAGNAALPSQYSSTVPANIGKSFNFWIRGVSNVPTYTPTPIPPQTKTSTPTFTPTTLKTATSTPTTTATPTPTATFTRTDTATMTDTLPPTFSPAHYEYVGVPLPRELLTSPWVDFTPSQGRVGETVELTVTGWHTFDIISPVWLKLGRGVGYDDCVGTAPGSTAQLVTNGRVYFRSTVNDTYRVCAKFREDWEPLNKRFVITRQPSADLFYGYSNCGDMAAANATNCGCWYGTGSPSIQMPPTFPIRYVETGDRVQGVLNFLCCADAGPSRFAGGVSGAGTPWGYCTNP